MTSKTSGSRRLKKSNLPKFDQDIYSAIPLSGLIVYSVHYLLEQKIEVKMEDIVFACFVLFPQKFALKKYPRWPDSAVISRRLSDRRSEGYIAANTDPGFKLTAKGSRLAEKVAKILGGSTSKQTVKARTGIPARKNKPVIRKEKIIGRAKMAQTPTPAKIVSKRKTILPARLRKTQSSLPNVNVVIAKLVQKEKTSLSASIMKAQASRSKTFPAIRGKKTQTSKSVVQTGKAEPTQLTLFKKTSGSAPDGVSKEVKIRAGKFVRLMERSDAYIHYKKNGKNSRISEFDFRSLLLCTMESSRETLARNVELFKGYAGVHERRDLVAFLSYCEDYFSSLLNPQPVKKTGRKK